MTMLSKVNNDAINENLKKRFENAEIYVSNIEKDLFVKDETRKKWKLFWLDSFIYFVSGNG